MRKMLVPSRICPFLPDFAPNYFIIGHEVVYKKYPNVFSAPISGVFDEI